MHSVLAHIKDLQPRPSLTCSPGKVQGLLTTVWQLESDLASYITLKTLQPAVPSVPDGKE